MTVNIQFLLNELSENGHLDPVYNVLNSGDPSDVVVTLMNVLNRTGNMPENIPMQSCKSESIANMFRDEGNRDYKASHFRSAFQNYNRSLGHAPLNSTALKLAYGNRSALLYTVKAYSACINDIDTIFSLGCPDKNLEQRLSQRKKECEKMKSEFEIEFQPEMYGNSFGRKFFNFNVRRHPEIYCASTDIKVAVESGLPKIIAAGDIAVGTLVAVESPSASEDHPENVWIACHYCHKNTLNLIPCDGCFVMFCNETCKKKCYTEFHDIVCQLYPRLIKSEPGTMMSIQAALRLKKRCNTWKELITASLTIGKERMRNSCVRDIYDEKSKFSILSFDNDLHFLHGRMLCLGLFCAIALHHLQYVPNFWPTSDHEKEAAVRAFARIMITLSMFYPKVSINNAFLEAPSMQIVSSKYASHGWFPFTGKLKHSCDANLLVLGLGNNVALITLRPIQKGSELNISYPGDYYANRAFDRHFQLFVRGLSPICTSRACKADYDPKPTANKMSMYQKWLYKMQNAYDACEPRGIEAFKATCEALAAFQNSLGTPEHRNIYVNLRILLSIYQHNATKNVSI